jgi:transposase
MTESRKRPRYTREFKQNSIELVLEQGYSGSEAGRRLGINAYNINRWVREHKEVQEHISAGGRPRREMETEIRRLKKEVHPVEAYLKG